MSQSTEQLHQVGVSLWLDNITRRMLDDGTLQRYINEIHVTGLTSNPSIFEQAIAATNYYDQAVKEKAQAGKSSEEIFFDLALEDLTRAAKLFQPIYERTQGLDGWVSLEVSPLIAYDTQTTVAEANRLYKAANTPNLFIKIPGTPEGIPAIEEAIFSGTPVNVTLLFSTEQYLASAEAWLRGVERRIEAGLNPDIRSVASVFVSRWDREAAAKAPEGFHNKLALAESMLTYQAYLEFLQSPRVLRVMNFGVKPQRLLWASTGTKDNTLSASHYVDTLVTPYTVNTIPESTLLAFADKGKVASALPTDGGDAQAVVAAFKAAGVDDHELATKLQVDGAAAFVKAWESLLAGIQSKI